MRINLICTILNKSYYFIFVVENLNKMREMCQNALLNIEFAFTCAVTLSRDTSEGKTKTVDARKDRRDTIRVKCRRK